MILEVSSTALKELESMDPGFRGQGEGNFINSKLSNLVVGSVRNPASDVLLVSTKGVFHDLNTQIKAQCVRGRLKFFPAECIGIGQPYGLHQRGRGHTHS